MRYLVVVMLVLLPSLSSMAADSVTPEEAAKMVGKEVTVEFKVQTTGGAANKVFLNSDSDHRSAKNFTIVLEKAAQDELAKDKIDRPRDHYKGKTVQVTGKVELFKDKPQIKVTKAKQIKIIDK